MSNIRDINELVEAFHWKLRQKYSQIMCYLRGGYYIWHLEEEIRFLSLQGDAFSHIIYVCKGHEKLEMKWCCRWIELGEPSQTIIDCGANIGYFSAVLAQTCSLNHIIAIEGNKHTAELCKQTFDILELKNITVIEAILAANSSDKYIIPDIPGREPWQQAVKADFSSDTPYTITIDEIVTKHKINPSLVKIDCEGFETLILKGANYLLSHIRPAFMIECNDNALKASGTNRYELFDLLLNFDYNLFHLASFREMYSLGVKVDKNFPASEFNFAAIPNDNKNFEKWQKSINFTSC